MIYRYNANIIKDNNLYTVEFPQFGIRGRGFPGYDDTVDFARDFLAEIIMDYQDAPRELPEEGASAGASGVVIEVDVDRYRKRAQMNAEKVFYDFETDEDVERRNQPAFAWIKRILG